MDVVKPGSFRDPRGFLFHRGEHLYRQVNLSYKEDYELLTGSGLYQELVKIDPEAAGKIDPNNLRRIIRALEVHARTQAPFSSLGSRKEPDFTSLTVGLTTDRATLYQIVDRRIDVMFEQGLVKEVENLLEMGYDFTLPAMSGIGYRQVGQYLRE